MDKEPLAQVKALRLTLESAEWASMVTIRTNLGIMDIMVKVLTREIVNLINNPILLVIPEKAEAL